MTQASVLNQKANELGVDLSGPPSEAIWAVYRGTIEAIREQLLYSRNLRTITVETLEVFELDLRKVIETVSRQGDKYINIPITSLDAALKNLSLARNELYIAMELLERSNTESNRRSFYTSLDECQKYLSSVLKYFR